MDPYRIPVEPPPTNKVILVIEPSPFRRAETYIVGPHNWLKAWIIALWMKYKYPYGWIRVVNAQCRVTLGSEVLWDERI